jgi:hypothetical protein
MPRLQELAKFTEDGLKKIGKISGKYTKAKEAADAGKFVKEMSTELISHINEFANDKVKALEVKADQLKEQISKEIDPISKSTEELRASIEGHSKLVDKTIAKADEFFHLGKESLNERTKELRTNLKNQQEKLSVEVESRTRKAAERLEAAVSNRVAKIEAVADQAKEVAKLAQDTYATTRDRVELIKGEAIDGIKQQLEEHKENFINEIFEYVARNLGSLLWRWIKSKIGRKK